MNATKRFSRVSARERERERIADKSAHDTVEFMILASAVTLHETFGFGEVRIRRFLDAIAADVGDMNDRYGSECTVTAMRDRAARYGIEIEFS